MRRPVRRLSFREILALTGMLAIASMPSLQLSASASTILPKSDPSELLITKTTPTHTIFLRCELNATTMSTSKGSILLLPNDLKNKKTDIALVTGHGLKDGKNCYVQDFHGNHRPVKAQIFANNYKDGTDTDWALISFKAIKGQHIKRYNIDNYVSNTGQLDKMSISFAQARGLPQNNQNCRLALVKMPTLKSINSIFTHNCKAISGQSGSPITKNMNGEDKLIGIHLGRIWTLRSPLTGSPGMFSFMRPFDKEMSKDIKAAIKQLQAD